jgi:hypothetical protein
MVIVSALVTLIGLASSVSSASDSGGQLPNCNVADLAEVFANPLSSANKVFCGRVYLFRATNGSIRFYADSTQAQVAPYDLVLLPLSRPPSLRAVKGSSFVYVIGRLEVEVGCFTGSPPGKPDIKESCVPFKRPIYIEVFSTSFDQEPGRSP